MNPTQALASIHLGQPVHTYIRNHRKNGLGWRAIATQLKADTDGRVRVSHETLRVWFAEEDAA